MWLNNTVLQQTMARFSILIALFLLSIGCSQNLKVERYGIPYSRMGQDFIPYRSSLPDGNDATLEDLAQSVPVFEGSPGRVGDDFGPTYQNDGRSWVLEGDGAQIPVRVDRLTAEKALPTRIRVTLGPNALYEANKIWIYTLEREATGWRKIKAETKSAYQEGRIKYNRQVIL